MQKIFNQILLFAAQSLCFIALPWWYYQNHLPTNGQQNWINLMLLSGLLGSFAISLFQEYLASYLTSIFVVGFALKYYSTAQYPLLEWSLKTFHLSIDAFHTENSRNIFVHLWTTFSFPIKSICLLFLVSSLALFIWKLSQRNKKNPQLHTQTEDF